MNWLINMKPNVRGWFVLTIGLFVLGLHWIELINTKLPKFSTAFTTPWFIVIGLMFLLYPQVQERQPYTGWLSNKKNRWKGTTAFLTVCVATGLLHYQLQKTIFV